MAHGPLHRFDDASLRDNVESKGELVAEDGCCLRGRRQAVVVGGWRGYQSSHLRACDIVSYSDEHLWHITKRFLKT